MNNYKIFALLNLFIISNSVLSVNLNYKKNDELSFETKIYYNNMNCSGEPNFMRVETKDITKSNECNEIKDGFNECCYDMLKENSLENNQQFRICYNINNGLIPKLNVNENSSYYYDCINEHNYREYTDFLLLIIILLSILAVIFLICCVCAVKFC